MMLLLGSVTALPAQQAPSSSAAHPYSSPQGSAERTPAPAAAPAAPPSRGEYSDSAQSYGGPSAGETTQRQRSANTRSPQGTKRYVPAEAGRQYGARQSPTSTANLPKENRQATPPPQRQEHPLMPVLRWAKTERKNLKERIVDYMAILIKQECVDGELKNVEHMFVKVRHEPFSVYLRFLGPEKVQGQEALYVEGQNDGKLIAHGVGLKSVFGTRALDPNGYLAMKGNKYPITDIGIVNLVDKLIEVGEQDVKYGECKVNYYENAKVNDRVCTCVEVIHPVPRTNFRFHIARIFIDNELNLPIHYASYDWPKKEGEKPPLIETYTYNNLRLNVGLTDHDFDRHNQKYNFD
jgi:hypothetical protein